MKWNIASQGDTGVGLWPSYATVEMDTEPDNDEDLQWIRHTLKNAFTAIYDQRVYVRTDAELKSENEA